MSRPPPRQLHANQLRMLEQQGFTTGLIQAVSHYVNTIPLRIWIIDNSATMQVADGHRILGSTFTGLTKSNCTRWDEAQDEVAFHAYMSACLGVPTRFNMVTVPVSATGMQLPSSFSISERGPAAVQQELKTARAVMGQVKPNSRATPLAYHIRQIRGMVVQMAPQLIRERKLVSVLIATSGLPTDSNGHQGAAVVQDFVEALKSLEGLPMQVVFRLCTDDEHVVDFYNTLDAQTTAASYDVVDDYFGEALEIYLKNPWLNYTLPLHRFRQLFSIPVFDGIDEETLSYPQLRQFCACLFPTRTPLPDPGTDWISFVRSLNALMQIEKMHFNPITGAISPWIDLRRLHLVYGRNIPLPPDIPTQMPHFQQQLWQQERHPYSADYPHRQTWQTNSDGSFPTQGTQHQQSASAPAPAAPPATETGLSADKYVQQASSDEGLAEIKRGIIRWATAPPSHQHLRPIEQLLGTIPETFPPAYRISDNAYFKKWKPFSEDALAGRNEAVLKRAMRKTKFFLHPDKLPGDLTKEQAFLCKMLWDIVADAWEAFDGS